jgi:hypothetical protein
MVVVMGLVARLTGVGFPETAVMSRYLHPVAAGAHATPTAAVILSRVIEKQYTDGVLTFLDA